MNGDSFCEFDLNAMVAVHQARQARATVLLTQVPDTQRFGRVRTGADDRVLAFEEKGAEPGSGWINAGVYLLERRLLETLSEHRALLLERRFFPLGSAKGSTATPLADGLDIGTPASFAQAEAFFSSAAEPRG